MSKTLNRPNLGTPGLHSYFYNNTDRSWGQVSGFVWSTWTYWLHNNGRSVKVKGTNLQNRCSTPKRSKTRKGTWKYFEVGAVVQFGYKRVSKFSFLTSSSTGTRRCRRYVLSKSPVSATTVVKIFSWDSADIFDFFSDGSVILRLGSCGNGTRETKNERGRLERRTTGILGTVNDNNKY